MFGLILEYFSTIVTILVGATVPTLRIWVYCLLYLIESFKQPPTLDFLDNNSNNTNTNGNKHPKVSIILAARNEEKCIGKCIDSLLNQDYPNFEIICVNDSSSDNTSKIMQEYQLLNSNKVIVINVKIPSEDWIGKNWACYQGYLKSSGEIFLFTDADTICSPCTLSMAVEHLSRDKLDALTIRPNFLCESIWSKIIFPVILTFSHVKYSSLRINNDKSRKHGYFFGCFYLIRRNTYETVGTHYEVKNQITEDVVLGDKVKQQGYKLKAYRGEQHISTEVPSRLNTTLQVLRRASNLIPFSRNDTFDTFLIWFLLVQPFLILVAFSVIQLYDFSTEHNLLIQNLLIYLSLVTLITMVIATSIQSKLGLSQNFLYGLASPLVCLILSYVFAFSLIKGRSTGTYNIVWRGRQYGITKANKVTILEEEE